MRLPMQLYDKAVQSGGVIDVVRLLAESQKPWAVDDYQYQFHGAQVQSAVVSASAVVQVDASKDCESGCVCRQAHCCKPAMSAISMTPALHQYSCS